MKKLTCLLTAATLLAGVIHAAAAPKDELLAAAKALADKPNYSWKTTVVVPEDAQFKPGPTDGKAEKGGVIMVSATGFQGNLMHTVKQGDKAALTNQDGDWESAADAESAEGFGRFRAMAARNLKAPADLVADIVTDVKELKQDGDVFSGEFTEEGAKNNMRFGGRAARGGPGGGPQILAAKGSAKFWVKDGVLAKMEIKVDGKMDFNGNEMEVIRTSTTEIKDVGTTKVEVPTAAKAKLK